MKTYFNYNDRINRIDACINFEKCKIECVRKKIFTVSMWWGNWLDGEINNTYCKFRLKKQNVIMSSYVTYKN